MNRILRILLVTFNQRKQGVLRYKIAYYHDLHAGYNWSDGDELDKAIKTFFADKNPTQCQWEYCGGYDENIGKRYFAGFCDANIPLIGNHTTVEEKVK